MTLGLGNRMVKRKEIWDKDNAKTYGDPITDGSEVHVEYEIVALATEGYHTDFQGEELVLARLRKVR